METKFLVKPKYSLSETRKKPNMPDHVHSAIGLLFSWSSERPFHPSLIIGSGLGIGIPMIISGWVGMIGMGCVISIRILAIANLSDELLLREQYVILLFACLADALAFLFGLSSEITQ
jgi:hypothetical protein